MTRSQARREIFNYRIGWSAQRRRQGEHRSMLAGDSGAWRGDILLRDASEARRLALRASLRDPLERLWVRDVLHTASLDLWVLVDLSGSMRWTGDGVAGCTTAARLIAAAAHSTHGPGDRLGVYCAANQPVAALSMPASRHLSAQLALAGRIAALAPANPSRTARPGDGVPDRPTRTTDLADGADGLVQALVRIGTRRSLVFIVSDFQPTRTDWSGLLRRFAAHQVVPVVTWNLPAVALAGSRGLLAVTDAETGMRQMIWMRRSVRARIRDALDAHHARIGSICRERGLRPLHLYEGFDAQAVTAWFHGMTPQALRPSQRCA